MSTRRSERTYRNPVIPGFHPDPSVCRVGDPFYLVYAPTIRWPDGTWVDQDGVDPSLLRDADGTWLLTTTAEPVPGRGHEAEPGCTRGVQQSVVDPTTGERGEVRFLWVGTGGRFPEAPPARWTRLGYTAG